MKLVTRMHKGLRNHAKNIHRGRGEDFALYSIGEILLNELSIRLWTLNTQKLPKQDPRCQTVMLLNNNKRTVLSIANSRNTSIFSVHGVSFLNYILQNHRIFQSQAFKIPRDPSVQPIAKGHAELICSFEVSMPIFSSPLGFWMCFEVS